MNKDEVLSKIQKMKALADKGVGGEKENAKKLLERLMIEYNITEQDLLAEVIKPHEFWFEKQIPFTERLLHQVVFAVVGNINDKKV